MAELLLELFSEEIPARMQARAADDLKRLVTAGLKDSGLEFKKAEAYVTPRRLTLVVDGLPLAQPDVKDERKGPRVGSPEKAIEGFLKAAGLSNLDECETREDPKKGAFYVAVIERKGQAAAQALPEIVSAAMTALPWPKSMRWGDYGVRWVRPLHSILCLFDGASVPVEFNHVKAGSSTFGHRFLAPDEIKVSGFADYETKLRAAKVMLDPAERREVILAEAEKLAKDAGLQLKADKGLLAEVAGLVEWPVVRVGAIDEAFMDLPSEVLALSMRAHQKYFSTLDADGNLAPRFIFVANNEARDGGDEIVKGNERVLRARLSDAKFFWGQDRKAPLEKLVDTLGDRVFHARLGSDLARVTRIRELGKTISAHVEGANEADADRAALLCKADLTSEMVYEFPELQGIMGRYYALNDGEKAEVAEAVAEHYSPQGPGDDCPSNPLSVTVALADKIDMLVGFFAIDEKPTGSKDPFALRRAALGAIRLIVENGLRLPLFEVFERARTLYAADGISSAEALNVKELLDFFADRMKVHLREKGVRHDLIAAVFALGGEDDLVRLLARVDALAAFLDTEDGADLLTAFRRAANIVRIEEKKDGESYADEADGNLLRQDEEKELSGKLGEIMPQVAAHIRDERFDEAMGSLARLRKPVDAFFDDVTVNCEEPDLRRNRLRLLSTIRSALSQVADFSTIEG
ncbi:MAG: glycine--tRNA ligase subunit beta [Rhodospirillales bacterium]|jgi:glycyl-tRNA synthetase beta chain|nr:glycine--tRNA ligase subunit beta [Rhodospirillales bacterium]